MNYEVPSQGERGELTLKRGSRSISCGAVSQWGSLVRSSLTCINFSLSSTSAKQRCACQQLKSAGRKVMKRIGLVLDLHQSTGHLLPCSIDPDRSLRQLHLLRRLFGLPRLPALLASAKAAARPYRPSSGGMYRMITHCVVLLPWRKSSSSRRNLDPYARSPSSRADWEPPSQWELVSVGSSCSGVVLLLCCAM